MAAGRRDADGAHRCAGRGARRCCTCCTTCTAAPSRVPSVIPPLPPSAHIHLAHPSHLAHTPADWVRDVAWAPNFGLPMNTLASAGQDGKVIVWTERQEGAWPCCHAAAGACVARQRWPCCGWLWRDSVRRPCRRRMPPAAPSQLTSRPAVPRRRLGAAAAPRLWCARVAGQLERERQHPVCV